VFYSDILIKVEVDTHAWSTAFSIYV